MIDMLHDDKGDLFEREFDLAGEMTSTRLFRAFEGDIRLDYLESMRGTLRRDAKRTGRVLMFKGSYLGICLGLFTAEKTDNSTFVIWRFFRCGASTISQTLLAWKSASSPIIEAGSPS